MVKLKQEGADSTVYVADVLKSLRAIQVAPFASRTPRSAAHRLTENFEPVGQSSALPVHSM